MARFFKYRCADDVAADALALGSRIDVSDDFTPLFAPVNIGPHQAGNRLCVQPMEGCDGTREGLPDELTYRRYRRFGAGGAKIIWGEATAIAEDARMNPRQLWLHDGSAAAIEDMLAGCRAAHREAFGGDADLVVGLQLTHSGRFSYQRPQLATHDPVLDPLTTDKSTGTTIDASYPLLSDDDLRRIEDQYLEAARLAWKIGVDFVDIKQCHRYLLSELLASRTRPGDYGGSLHNRTRLVRNVIGRIREELPELTIATRMNAYDGIPYRAAGPTFLREIDPSLLADKTDSAGIELIMEFEERLGQSVSDADYAEIRTKRDAVQYIREVTVGRPCPHEFPLIAAFGTCPYDHRELSLNEPLELVRRLREWGVALINVSAGNPYANPHVVRPAEFPPVDGYDAPEHPLLGVLRQFRLAREIQQAVPDVPVVGSGYSWLQDYAPHAAAANVRDRHVAIVGLGRMTLAHPDFAQALAESGRLARRRVCRTFSYCTNLMRTKDHPLGQYATGCPPFDKEVYGPLWKEAEAKLFSRGPAGRETG